ncbi:MAG: tRNA lysidine(34) synthetase TilS [Rhodobacteraceae bacterium]|nr:tRNA lysidine(34) synthetase TilS [Paracoccaceae bacterium]
MGLAVSGGGDSVALLHLAVEAGCTVAVATVDHGLRPEARAEAADVAAHCAELGVPHAVLEWRWDGRGNLADAARRGRMAALADWARAAGLAAVALGHTQDDVAETFLMRLARDAGVDGLAAMAARREVGGMTFLRPLMAIARAELRGWLLSRGLDWAEDPTNEDARFARVRARRAVAAMADAGVAAEQIAALAGRMADVRAALDGAVAEAAARIARLDRGDVILEGVGLAQLPVEIRRRLMRAAVMWIGSAEYGPRGAELERFIAAALEGRAATLGGCRMTPGRGRLRITREARAVAGLVCATDQLWDGRWRLAGPENEGNSSDLTIRALGPDGLAQLAGAEGAAVPRLSLLAAPAVWRGDVLVAAPLAGHGAGWNAACTAPFGPLSAAPLSH